jgi:hypothetical protein
MREAALSRDLPIDRAGRTRFRWVTFRRYRFAKRLRVRWQQPPLSARAQCGDQLNCQPRIFSMVIQPRDRDARP